MKFSLFRSARALLFSLCLASTLAVVAADRQRVATPALEREIVSLVRLLEEYHYNRDGVRQADYGQVIPDYMKEFDGHHLFFLDSDKKEFTTRYPASWLYNNISSLGKIDPAFEIFARYEERATSRIHWILDELKKEVDLNTQDTYVVDRTEVDWPSTVEEADDLWRKRLKYELILEMLNKKSAEEARTDIRKRYERRLKDLKDMENYEISEIFLSAITRLYDPHSTYLSADTFEDFGIQMRLQLVGIGALLGTEEDYCVVKELITGGPADIGKQLRPNDKIIAVAQGNQEPVEVIGMKLRKIVDLIRGKKGTPVRLIVKPAAATDSSQRKEILLVRDVVNLNSARARAGIYDLPDASGKTRPIGVITLPAFYGPDNSSDAADRNSATQDVAELLRQLQQTGIQGLVLDLRHNGGGLLSEAIDLAGLFIKHGPVVQIKNLYGEVKVNSDEDPSLAYTGPMAVLVSKFSASASEIVAGALQNYGRAVIIGDSSTHGKGSVQQLIEMKNTPMPLARLGAKTGAVKLTVQKFYLPDGHSTQLKGVVPDIVLPSIDDFLPVGEKDLPRALVWDEIQPSFFDGKPLDQKVLSPLREASTSRQSSLEEFSYLKKNIDWFKTKQDQKMVLLNYAERERQKETDKAFRKDMNAEKERLAKNDYPVREFTLGPPKAPAPAEEPKKETDDPADLASMEDDKKLDIHLREALRVINDAIDMASKGELWAHEPPLTAQAVRKS
jgi:carboxyl-terminal processing protease